jgi:hypothetical protein
MCMLSSELGSWKLGFPERSMDTIFKEFFRTQNSRFHFESPLELVVLDFCEDSISGCSVQNSVIYTS